MSEAPPIKVFVSYTRRCTDPDHAALGDCGASGTCQSSLKFAVELTEGLEAAGFDVLRDEERLEVGEHWRSDLIEMLADCDAGIVVLSSPALESEWVQHEAAILKYRHDSAGLPLIPVLLPGVTEATVVSSGLAALDLPSLQMARAQDAFEDPSSSVSPLVELVRNKFVDRDPQPERDVKANLRSLLGTLQWDMLELILEKLELGQRWIRHEQLCRVYTREAADALLRVDVQTAAQAIAKLAWQPQFDSGGLHGMLRLLEPFWVDRDAALTIRKGARGRAYAINAQHDSTAQAYLARAACKPGPYVFVTVLGVVGEDPATELREAILVALGEKLGVSREELHEELQWKLESEPIFVVLSDGVSGVALSSLLHDRQFEGLSFLVLTGDRLPDSHRSSTDAELIKPLLEDGAEQQTAQNLRRARSTLNDALEQAGKAT